jgi:Papain family cysteine protease
MPLLTPEEFRSAQFELDGVWYLKLPDQPPRYLGKYVYDWLSEGEESQFTYLLQKYLADTTVALPKEHFISGHHAPAGDALMRDTCVSFALVAAIEARFSRDGRQIGLSEQYCNWMFMQAQSPALSWCCSGLRLIDGARLLLSNGICRREWCPYPAYISNCERNYVGPLFADCLEKPSSKALKDASYQIKQYFAIPGARTDGVKKNTIADTDLLRRLVFMGYDIAVSVINAFASITDVDRVNVASRDQVVAPLEGDRMALGHALLIVGYGYAETDKLAYFICKNCAGVNDPLNYKGYMRVSEEYLQTYARYGVFVSAVTDGKFSQPELAPIF